MDDKFPEEKAIRLARENFWKGFHCSEAILIAMAEYIGVTSELIPKIATGFGGGIASSGLICGALVGGVMVIGIKYGRTSPEENPQPVWDLMDNYVAAFKEKFGAVNCRQLTRLNLKTEKGLQQYFARVHDYECTERLKFAVEKAAEILSK